MQMPWVMGRPMPQPIEVARPTVAWAYLLAGTCFQAGVNSHGRTMRETLLMMFYKNDLDLHDIINHDFI